jgi:chorismate-pyruvate lyase
MLAWTGMRRDLYVSMKRSGIDPESLKDVHRIILTTDGTVTDILEAYTREAMKIELLRQESASADSEPSARWLHDAPGTAILRREILLRGEISGSCHLYARSVIAVERLPAAIRDGLLEKKQPIGHLLLQHRVHTFKEIVECRREPASQLASVFALGNDAPLLSRSYIVSIDHHPVMEITEQLPEFGR